MALRPKKLRHFVEVSDDATRLRIVEAVLEELPPTNHEPERRTRAREQLARWVQAQNRGAPPEPSHEFTLREARSDEGLPVVRLHPKVLSTLDIDSGGIGYLASGPTGTYVQVRGARGGEIEEPELLAPRHVISAIQAQPGSEVTLEPDELRAAEEVEVTVAVRSSDDESFYSPVQAGNWVESTRRTVQGLPVAPGDVLRVKRGRGETILVNVDNVSPGQPMVVGPETDLRPSAESSVEKVPDGGLSRRAQELFKPVLQEGKTGVAANTDQVHALLDNDLARGEDLLDREREYNALARMAAAWRLEPPLALGVFGDWGSGKTFFMDRMRHRVEDLSRGARGDPRPQREVPYCKRVAQVRFNAWHYQGSNLWASLVDHIFNNLRYEEDDEEDVLEARKEQLLEDLEAAKELQREAQEEAEAAESQVDVAREQLDEAKEDLRTAFDDPVGWAEAAADAAKDDLLSDVVGRAGDDAGEALEELYHEARDLGGPLSSLSFGFRHIPRNFKDFWGVLLVTVVLVGGVALAGWAGWISALWAKISGTAAAVGPIALRLNAWSRRVKGRLEAVNTRVERQARAAVAVHEAELESRREALTQALMAEQEAKARVQRLSGEARKLSPGQLLAEFIEDRADSEDYRQHLGLHAQVRNDFDRLTRHFSRLRDAEEHGREGEFLGGPPSGGPGTGAGDERAARSVNRIVLYIDDLDRCSPDRVVEVLEAVHLLLAFPLFVVVVAVDARWVTHAIETQHPHLAPQEDGDDTRSATPYDYLEKIFQVPLWLRPLRPDDARRIVSGCIDGDEGWEGETQEDDNPPEQVDETPDQSVEAPDGRGGGGSPDGPQPGSEILGEGGGTSPGQPGSGGPAIDDHKPLLLAESERRLLEELAPVVGRSPRSLKRFVNSYRILKATAPPKESTWVVDTGGAASPAETLFLLAVVARQGRMLEAFRTTLYEGNHTSLDGLLDSVQERLDPSAPAQWRRLNQFADQEIRGRAEPELVARLKREFSRVERYAFEAPTSSGEGPAALSAALGRNRP